MRPLDLISIYTPFPDEKLRVYAADEGRDNRIDLSAMPDAFQTCGACKRAWTTWDEFVTDPAVRLLGLQAVIHLPDVNLLVFEHTCGSSISILSRRLRHLLPAPGPNDPPVRLLQTEQCRGHCLVLGDMAMCDAPCSNARDRELIRLVQRVKKSAAKPEAR